MPAPAIRTLTCIIPLRTFVLRILPHYVVKQRGNGYEPGARYRRMGFWAHTARMRE